MDFKVLPETKSQGLFHQIQKKSHFADFLTEQTLDFVLHCLLGGLAEMHTDDIGCLRSAFSQSGKGYCWLRYCSFKILL